MTAINRLTETRYGPMLVHARDKYIATSLVRYGEFSEGEVTLFRHYVRPGAVVLDVGANMGALTVPLAQMAGDRGIVFAFEPQRLTFQVLAANVALNSLTNVHALLTAVGAKPGVIMVPQLDLSREGVSVGSLALGGYTNGAPVPVITIDALGLPACDFVKVDVEGMERDVLAGARDTIVRCRPVLYVENDRPDQQDDVFADLFEMGYRPYWHCPPLYQRENWRNDPTNEFIRGDKEVMSINVLALPNECDDVPTFPHLMPI